MTLCTTGYRHNTAFTNPLMNVNPAAQAISSAITDYEFQFGGIEQATGEIIFPDQNARTGQAGNLGR